MITRMADCTLALDCDRKASVDGAKTAISVISRGVMPRRQPRRPSIGFTAMQLFDASQQ